VELVVVFTMVVDAFPMSVLSRKFPMGIMLQLLLLHYQIFLKRISIPFKI
jgi:hypothetical protein